MWESGAWRRGNGSNLVGVAAPVLGSAAFNDQPRPLHIAGVREENDELFRRLNETPDLAKAGDEFTAYMTALFGLDAPKERSDGSKRYRASYLRLLRGWAYDSNSPEGAVLKGWVESRFGLFPTFHHEPLRKFSSEAWSRYLEDKMGSRFHNNAIFSQVDLLYEFAQWALARFSPSERHWRLYRGVNDFEEHPIIERMDKNRVVLRLNNLTSFTSHRDVAECFGDRILETLVPMCKVVFFNTLLSRHAVKGEDEVMAVGGDYLVTASFL